MSKKKGSLRVTRSEYREIRREAKAGKTTALLAKKHNRSETIVRRIRKSRSWDDYRGQNAERRGTRPPLRAVVPHTTLTVGGKPLEEALATPERRSKAHAAEVLDLKTKLVTAQREIAKLNAANELLNAANDHLAAEAIVREGRARRSLIARIRRKVGL